MPGRGPLLVECSACQAKAGQPCTQATSTRRTPVTWFHMRREELAATQLVEYQVRYTDDDGNEVTENFATWDEAREQAGMWSGELFEVRKLDDFREEQK